MDVKQVQTDTLSHLILSRGSTYSLAPVGDVGMTQECIAASDIYNQNSSDVSKRCHNFGTKLTCSSCILDRRHDSQGVPVREILTGICFLQGM